MEGDAGLSQPRLFSITGQSVAFTRSLGDRGAADVILCVPEVTNIGLREFPLQRVVVASDGVWDVFTND